MKKWKRALSCVAAAAMTFALAACSQQTQQSQSPSSEAQTTPPETTQAEIAGSTDAGETPADSESAGGNTLVVYFSATGNTGTVAGYISESLGADVYEIVPEEPYTSEDLVWSNDSSRVSTEHADLDFRPEIAGELPDLSGYDTIFVGYPIWWGEAPNIVWNFVENADLAGKTMIPFCTSSSSDFGSSGETLRGMAPDADWLDGQRFRSSVSEEDVVDWVNGLDLNIFFLANQILSGETGDIHYSYHMPQDYDESRTYPMMVVMPGYDRMWFGEESAGRNLDWNGTQAWLGLDEDIIVVSAQLTDWGETSARQALELTEYFLEHFSVDQSRVYAAGYSAGGETMSRAVAMRPDLFAAYLHGASQWDGTFDAVAQAGTAVYIFMAENDEYYGSDKAREAWQGLYEAWQRAGYSQEQIAEVLVLEIPDDEYFNSRGIDNYHGGGNVMFDDETILEWILSKHK